MRLWAEIDSSRLAYNLKLLRDTVFPSEIMLVVKANAYGHGLEPIVQIADKLRVEWIGVTSANEAESVFISGYRGKIFCFFEPEDEDEAEYLISKNISFNLFSRKTLETTVKASRRLNKPAHVHVKINTGMNRLGLRPKEFEGYIELIKDKKEILLDGLWTHFATSELPENEFVIEQLKEFNKLARKAKKVFPDLILHAANTGGALYYPEARLDLVRIGIGAYGYFPSFDSPRVIDLQPVLKLKAKITSVNLLTRGEGVSYGLRWKAEKETYVGIVSAGYADGIPYQASGKINVRYKDRIFKQVGSICMDQFAVNFEDMFPEIGDEVEIIYEDQTAEDIAKKSQTITYEILTGIGSRVQRVVV
ncbi:MAG: alanine racemase [Actinobacteria bacterium]|nr:alanine racemase [Actinomycetota bacterium]